MLYAHNRHIFEITGHDRLAFLQGLVTMDVPTRPKALAYSALLTPQGKFMADFFLFQAGEIVYLDAAAADAQLLTTRLNMYKLRADVTITDSKINVFCGTGQAPNEARLDPRDQSLGWRLYGPRKGEDGSDWTSLRVAACVPANSVELTSDSYILENRFEHLQGVDFKKGCYVGQEITARMKHKAILRKGLALVRVSGEAPVGTKIKAGKRTIGVLYSQSNGLGLAYLRFDRATSDMRAGSACVLGGSARIRLGSLARRLGSAR